MPSVDATRKISVYSECYARSDAFCARFCVSIPRQSVDLFLDLVLRDDSARFDAFEQLLSASPALLTNFVLVALADGDGDPLSGALYLALFWFTSDRARQVLLPVLRLHKAKQAQKVVAYVEQALATKVERFAIPYVGITGDYVHVGDIAADDEGMLRITEEERQIGLDVEAGSGQRQRTDKANQRGQDMSQERPSDRTGIQARNAGQWQAAMRLDPARILEEGSVAATLSETILACAQAPESTLANSTACVVSGELGSPEGNIVAEPILVRAVIATTARLRSAGILDDAENVLMALVSGNTANVAPSPRSLYSPSNSVAAAAQYVRTKMSSGERISLRMIGDARGVRDAALADTRSGVALTKIAQALDLPLDIEELNVHPDAGHASNVTRLSEAEWSRLAGILDEAPDVIVAFGTVAAGALSALLGVDLPLDGGPRATEWVDRQIIVVPTFHTGSINYDSSSAPYVREQVGASLAAASALLLESTERPELSMPSVLSEVQASHPGVFALFGSDRASRLANRMAIKISTGVDFDHALSKAYSARRTKNGAVLNASLALDSPYNHVLVVPPHQQTISMSIVFEGEIKLCIVQGYVEERVGAAPRYHPIFSNKAPIVGRLYVDCKTFELRFGLEAGGDAVSPSGKVWRMTVLEWSSRAYGDVMRRIVIRDAEKKKASTAELEEQLAVGRVGKRFDVDRDDFTDVKLITRLDDNFEDRLKQGEAPIIVEQGCKRVRVRFCDPATGLPYTVDGVPLIAYLDTKFEGGFLPGKYLAYWVKAQQVVLLRRIKSGKATGKHLTPANGDGKKDTCSLSPLIGLGPLRQSVEGQKLGWSAESTAAVEKRSAALQEYQVTAKQGKRAAKAEREQAEGSSKKKKPKRT